MYWWCAGTAWVSDGVNGRTFDQALDPVLGEDAARLLGRVLLLVEPLPEGGEQALFSEAAAGEGDLGEGEDLGEEAGDRLGRGQAGADRLPVVLFHARPAG